MGHFNVSWFWNNDNIKAVLELLVGVDKPIFHICSGCSAIGDVRMDKTYIELPDMGNFRDKYRSPCNIRGDLNHLPFKDGVAGCVICDPPYDYDFTDMSLINEISRISKPKARIIFIAPWIPKSPVLQIKNHNLWIVGKKRPYYKIASIFYKINGQLGDYNYSTHAPVI